MVKVEVRLKDDASPALKALIDALEGETAQQLNEVGARGAVKAAMDYHREFAKNKGWRGNNYLGGPGRSGPSNKSGDFAQNIVLGWNFTSADRDGAVISNAAPFYKHKVEGGTIKPITASALTLPLIAGAVGRRVKQYETENKTRLFRPKGKDVLMEKTANNGVRAVYALRKSVTQKAWPGALPDEETIGKAFTASWIGGLKDEIKKANK